MSARAECISDCFVQRLGAVDLEQQRAIGRQTALDQVGELLLGSHRETLADRALADATHRDLLG
jgi:hypothetical protein